MFLLSLIIALLLKCDGWAPSFVTFFDTIPFHQRVFSMGTKQTAEEKKSMDGNRSLPKNTKTEHDSLWIVLLGS